MKNFSLVVFFGICISFSPVMAYVLNPESDLDKKIDNMLFAGMELLYEGAYTDAFSSFQRVIDLVPEHPAGYFYYAAAIESLIVEHKNHHMEDDFYKKIDLTIDKAKKIISKDKKNGMAHLYLGAAYGYRGIYRAKYGNFLQAFIDGSNGYKYLKRTIVYNPKIYDAYFGIGMYEFFKAYYLKQFLWLKVSEVTKEEAFDRVKISVEKAKYCRREAEFSILTMFFLDKRFEKLTKKGEEMKSRFSKKIHIHFFLANSYFSLENYKKSQEEFNKIRELLTKSPYSKKESFITVDFYKIAIDHKTGKKNPKKTIELLKRFIESLDEIKSESRNEKNHVSLFEKKAKILIRDIKKTSKDKKLKTTLST